MAVPKQKFREVVFLWLFSQEFSPDEEEMVDFLMAQLRVTRKIVKEAMEIFIKISSLLPDIDALIANYSKSYAPERIGRVEKTALRLAIYELCYEQEVPPRVVMAEGIRLTRKFSVGESSSFVNAILDALYVERITPSEEQLVVSTPIST